MDLHVCELGKVNDIPKVAKAIKGFLGSVAPTVNVTTKTSRVLSYKCMLFAQHHSTQWGA